MNLLDKKQMVAVEEMSSVGVRVSFDGNVVPLKWPNLNDADLVTLAMASLPGDAQTVYEAGVLAAAIHADPQIRRDIFAALSLLDPEKAKQLKEFIAPAP